MTSLKHLLWPCFLLGALGVASAQDPHPAFTPPSGFTTTAQTDQERTFEQAVPNGDRLRIRVLLQPAGGEPEAIARGPAVEEGDQLRDDTKGAIKSGVLSGVTFSAQGKAETIDGVAYTRYRRVMGLRIEGNPIVFAARADILAKEPRPAQSTLEAMARALTEWQERIGGTSKTPPPDPGGNPASKPALGGDQIVRLTGGGDLEIQVPAFWGRANLKHAEGHEEIILGPAREVLEKVTTETVAKDKDRIGPYVSITRIQKDAFKDLVDVQLLDIKESLLADYVARQADAGITLTLSANRDEGTLGTRTVISVPFDEKRSSGTTHRGRSVFMMHRGSLVIVTASHPVEKFDEGWPDIAKAFDTLLFTGTEEPDPAASRPAADTPVPAPAPAPGPDQTVQPATPISAAPKNTAAKLAPAPAEWTHDVHDAVKTVEIPTATPISLLIPAGWTLLADDDATRAVQTFVATPKSEGSLDPLGSSLRIDYVAFREELAVQAGLSRLASLMRLRLEQDARALGFALTVPSAQDISLGGRAGHAIQYTLNGGERAASGTLLGTVLDGTAIVIDLRIASEDASALIPLSAQLLGAIRINVKEELATKTFGPFSMLVPQGWELSDSENPGGGRNVFVRAPSGVDVRFQTAPQKRYEVIDTEVLRRVSSGFLVEGLKVLTLKDLAAAKRALVPGGGPGLRFEASTPQMNVLVTVSQQRQHTVFALRGAPPKYYGRDLAIAWAVMQSFVATGVDRATRADPVRVAGTAVARRVAFYRTELDGVAPDATYRPESSLFIALLPDATAGVVAYRNGKTDDARGTYKIEGDLVTIEGPGLGRMVYRLAEDGEVLRGEAPGDVLFRARDEETP